MSLSPAKKPSQTLFHNFNISARVKCHKGCVRQIAWVIDAESRVFVASAGSDKAISICRLRETAPFLIQVVSVNAHDGEINGLSWSDRETLLLSCSNDKTVKIWHPERDSELVRFKHSEIVRAVAFCPTDRHVFVACTGKSAVIWNIDDNAILYTLTFSSPTTAVAWTLDGQKVAIGCKDSRVYFRTKNFGYITDVKISEKRDPVAITSMSFLGLPGGSQVLTGEDQLIMACTDDRIRYLTTRTYEIDRKYVGISCQGFTPQLSVSPDYKHIIANSPVSKKILIWDVDPCETWKQKYFRGNRFDPCDEIPMPSADVTLVVFAHRPRSGRNDNSGPLVILAGSTAGDLYLMIPPE